MLTKSMYWYISPLFKIIVMKIWKKGSPSSKTDFYLSCYLSPKKDLEYLIEAAFYYGP